jgi:hypothetical protein
VPAGADQDPLGAGAGAGAGAARPQATLLGPFSLKLEELEVRKAESLGFGTLRLPGPLQPGPVQPASQYRPTSHDGGRQFPAAPCLLLGRRAYESGNRPHGASGRGYGAGRGFGKAIALALGPAEMGPVDLLVSVAQLFHGWFDSGSDIPLDRAGELVVDLASGDANAPSGRCLDMHHYVRVMVARANEIRLSPPQHR